MVNFFSIHLVEGGMDFRAMLMKKKKPQKKVVVVRMHFLAYILPT